MFPCINSCIEIYGDACDYLVDKLHFLNNNILRILQFKDGKYPVSKLYSVFNLLPIRQLRLYRMLTFMCKWVHVRSSLPDSFWDAFVFERNMHCHKTRNELDLHIISCRIEYYKRSYKYYGAIIWNNLDKDLKCFSDIHLFLHKLKVQLMQQVIV